MSKVWIVRDSGSVVDCMFDSDNEGYNYAKDMSSRALVSICQYGNGRAFFFENGELASAARQKELAKDAEEVITQSMMREQAIVRKNIKR